mgnify:CR=1 FL=1
MSSSAPLGIFDSGIGGLSVLREIRSRIAARGVESNFLVVTEALPLCPILQRSDLFVRPTNTDGDALSVREALYLRVPALASDVVPRPRGTRLFRTRDAADLRRRADDLYTEGLREFSLGNLENAIRRWNEVLAIDETYTPARQYLAIAEATLIIQGKAAAAGTGQ